VFDGPSTMNEGTFKILEPSGLFNAGSRETIPQQTLTVVSPGIGVAARSTTTYRSSGNVVRFLDIATPGAAVVEDRDGETVVFHRVVTE
jgi:hypothetical protein